MSSIKSDHGTKLLKAVASDAKYIIFLVVFIKLSCNNRAFVQPNVIVIELVNDGKGNDLGSSMPRGSLVTL